MESFINFAGVVKRPLAEMNGGEIKDFVYGSGLAAVHTDGDVGTYGYYARRYLVLDRLGEDGAVHRTIYGEPPEGGVLSPEEENSAIAESFSQVEKAKAGYEQHAVAPPFEWELHRKILQNAAELKGEEPMFSSLNGVGMKQVLLPPTRKFVPFKVSYEWSGSRGHVRLLLADLSSPDAEIYATWMSIGTLSNGIDVRIYRSAASGKGFDFTQTRWPKEIPVDRPHIKRVIDEIGKTPDCCGCFPKLRTEEIRTLF